VLKAKTYESIVSRDTATPRPQPSARFSWGLHIIHGGSTKPALPDCIEAEPKQIEDTYWGVSKGKVVAMSQRDNYRPAREEEYTSYRKSLKLLKAQSRVLLGTELVRIFS
jgi:hypothetical protein